MTTRLVGIAGPSCSGKTELARWLGRRTGAAVLNLDHYYKELSHLPLEVRARTNFDEPASVDSELIFADAGALKAGRAIQAPLYDFAQHNRVPGGELIEPGELVILEGLFTLYWAELRDLLDVRLFVSAPDEVCFERRLRRDTVERGRTAENVQWQFDTTVRPMAHLHILPTREYACLDLPGTSPLDEIGERALALILQG